MTVAPRSGTLLRAVRSALADGGIEVRDLTVLDDRHADRPVFAGTLLGPRGAEHVVVKRYTGTQASSAATTAHAVAEALWTGSLGRHRPAPGLPRPVAVVASAGLVVAQRIDAPALGARGHLGGSLALATDAARLLADLHASELPASLGVRRRDAAAIVRSVARKVAEIDRPLRATASTIVDRLAALELVEPLVPTHGDFTPRNLLAAPDGLRLIDLDRVRLAARGRDVGYWRAWCWATQLLAGDRPAWDLTAPFVAAYVAAAAAHGPAAPDVPASLGFHTAAGLVRIVHGWSALRGRTDLQLALLGAASAELDGSAPRAPASARCLSRGR